jgi:glycoprotein endo-alpha-1,2-mannosidase
MRRPRNVGSFHEMRAVRRLAVALGALWAVLGAASGAVAATSTVVPAADAYVRSDAATQNFGRSTALRVDGAPVVRSYLKFVVPTLSGPVTKATLRIYATSAQSRGFDVYSTSPAWTETGLTYANAPALGTGRGASGPVAAGTLKTVDVTAAVGGSGTLAFALATTSATALALASRESATAPQLIVETGSAPPPPPPAPGGVQIGAYFYPWYGPNRRHWSAGYVRARLATPQLPVGGEYDSRSPETIARQLGWAQQYGVDYFISSWWGAGTYEDVTTRNHVMTSRSIGSTKVALLYESLSLLPRTGGLITFDEAAESKLISDFDYLARTYFGHPSYLNVNGRPVVVLYVTRIWRGTYAQAIANLRSTIKARYGYDLYLVGDEVDWDGSPNADRIRRFDAVTAYTMYSDLQTPGWPADTGYLPGVRTRYNAFKSVADAHGVRFIPNVLPQFNDRGVRLAANHYVLPPEVQPGLADTYSLFSQFLSLGGDYVDPQLRMLTVTSWNEWHEDTQIEPTAPVAASSGPSQYTQGYTYHSYGFKLLDILRAFSNARGG